MKIVVNKEANKNRLAEMVADVIKEAKAAAKKGDNYFVYYTGYTRIQMYSVGNLTSEVYSATEGSVRCCERGDHGSHINFEIVSVRD